MDVVVTNLGEAPTLLINKSKTFGQSVTFSLEKTGTNSAAIGARIKIDLGNRKMIREVKAGESYLSQSQMILHFGLNKTKVIPKVVVTWPDGTRQIHTRVEAGQHHSIRKGKASIISTPHY